MSSILFSMTSQTWELDLCRAFSCVWLFLRGDTRSFLTASVTELHSLAASGSGMFGIVLQSCMSLLTHTQTTSHNRTRILSRSCFHADSSSMILSRTCVNAHRDTWIKRTGGIWWHHHHLDLMWLDVTWSCRSHRMLGLRVQRTSCRLREWHFGGALWLSHCICTWYSSFPTFSMLSLDVSLFLEHSLEPFSTLACSLGICGVLGLFCTTLHCDLCVALRLSFSLLLRSKMSYLNYNKHTVYIYI